MLRQALNHNDDDGDGKSRPQQRGTAKDESVRLLIDDGFDYGSDNPLKKDEQQHLLLPYSSIDGNEGNESHFSDDDDDDDDDEEGEHSDDGWSEDDSSFDDENNASRLSQDAGEKNAFQRLWATVGKCCRVFADVDNIWDSSPRSGHRGRSRRNVMIVMTWFVVLAVSYAMERVTFKVLVDRLGPYRLFGGEVIVLTHAIFLSVSMIASAASRGRVQWKPLGLPVMDVACRYPYCCCCWYPQWCLPRRKNPVL